MVFQTVLWYQISNLSICSLHFKPSAVAENVFSLTLNVGWKCHFQFSQLSQLHEWNFFQLSEWKNYCHFLWLSIYLLQHSINLYTPKTFSARVVPKSNFFSAGKYILTTTCCWIVIASIFISCLKIIFQSYYYVNLMSFSLEWLVVFTMKINSICIPKDC